MKIDNSMLTTFKEECERKFLWRYVHHLAKPAVEGPLVFGEAIHKAMDAFWVGAPVETALTHFNALVPEDLDEKRTVAAGHAIIRDYYNTYRDQPFKLVSVEQSLPLQLGHAGGVGDVEFWGKLDKVVEWMYGIAGMDHKTTSLYLSSYSRQPIINNQFTGYMAILKSIHPGAYGFIIDAIHVPRPLKSGVVRTDFSRIPLTRTDKELEEWKKDVLRGCEEIGRAHEEGHWRRFGNDCHSFNRECPYHELCEYWGSGADEEEVVHSAIASGNYEERRWEPWKSQ